MRRAGPCWRNTRAHQGSAGADPHDDFLDTPMEIVKNLNRGPLEEEAEGLPVPPPQDMDFNNWDDETRDMNAEAAPQQQHISILGSANKGFKYVEPARKKAERENLKGVECKQCKKFYDAVLLPDGSRGKGSGTNTTSMHCEHHVGVSRHRYRYAPPMTPEGFWNIGFDSEL